MRGPRARPKGLAGTLRSEAGAMRTALAAWGCARSFGLVAGRRAHILKGVYEVNHLVCMHVLSHTRMRSRSKRFVWLDYYFLLLLCGLFFILAQNSSTWCFCTCHNCNCIRYGSISYKFVKSNLSKTTNSNNQGGGQIIFKAIDGGSNSVTSQGHTSRHIAYGTLHCVQILSHRLFRTNESK